MKVEYAPLYVLIALFGLFSSRVIFNPARPLIYKIFILLFGVVLVSAGTLLLDFAEEDRELQ